MKMLSFTLILLFSLCACAFGVADSRLQPEWIEGDLKNVNKDDSHSQNSRLLIDENVHSLNSKLSSVVLSVTREPEEDVTDNYSLEDSEHDTTEDEQTEQDDNPIIISSELDQEEVTTIFSNSSESYEKHKTNISEGPLHPLEPLSSAEVLKGLDKMMALIKSQEIIINELKKNSKTLQAKYDHIDFKTKQNNIIFMNIREPKHENYMSLLQKVLQILNRKMRLRVSIDNIEMASRLNNRNTSQFRPVVVTFTNYATKLKVLAARGKLKKSKYDIVDDYSELVNQTRRLLLPFLYEKRRQGHKVTMVRDRLIVDGVKKSLSELEQESSGKVQEEDSKPKDVEDQCSQGKLKTEKKMVGA